MDTTQLELLRREAVEEEIREKELLRQKYKKRKSEKKEGYNLDPEKQAIIEQAHKEEEREKELLRQKYKKREGNGKENRKIDPEKQALIERAKLIEKQEKELLRQKYKNRSQQKSGQPSRTEDAEKHLLLLKTLQQEKKELNWKLNQKNNITTNTKDENHLFEDSEKKINENNFENSFDSEILTKEEYLLDEIEDESEIVPGNLPKEKYQPHEIEHNNEISPDILNDKTDSSHVTDYEEEPFSEDVLDINTILSEDMAITQLESEVEEVETVGDTIDNVEDSIDSFEDAIDRTALLEKYNIHDVGNDEVDQLLESFDRSLSDENVEQIEEKLVRNITNTALSHPKIQWVNVLIFLDSDEIGGTIKIFAEFNDGNIFNRLRSDNSENLEVELIQIALYEVWDVFTTLGVNTDDLEMKIDVEVELDRA